MRTQKHKSSVAIFKDSNGYFIQRYSEGTINQFEEDKKRIEEKYNAKFVYKSEVKNLNQSLGLKKLIDAPNKFSKKLLLEKLEALLQNE